MDLSEIMTATQVLLGELSPGSSSYDDQYMDAIQWAQEEVCRFLGLSYVEAYTPWAGVTGPTGEVVSTVYIPADCIKVERIFSIDLRSLNGGFANTGLTSFASFWDGGHAPTLPTFDFDGGGSGTNFLGIGNDGAFSNTTIGSQPWSGSADAGHALVAFGATGSDGGYAFPLGSNSQIILHP